MRISDRPTELVRVYVWEWPLRVTHWVSGAAILVLSATGLLVAHPPGTLCLSRSRTLRPAFARVTAPVSPPFPAPITTAWYPAMKDLLEELIVKLYFKL